MRSHGDFWEDRPDQERCRGFAAQPGRLQGGVRGQGLLARVPGAAECVPQLRDRPGGSEGRVEKVGGWSRSREVVTRDTHEVKVGHRSRFGELGGCDSARTPGSRSGLWTGHCHSSARWPCLKPRGQSGRLGGEHGRRQVRPEAWRGRPHAPGQSVCPPPAPALWPSHHLPKASPQPSPLPCTPTF